MRIGEEQKKGLRRLGRAMYLKVNRWGEGQIFHYIRGNTKKRVTSLRGPSLRHCARVTSLLSKCLSGGEP